MDTGTETCWKVRWPDGSTTTGRSATEVILRIAAKQWQPMGKQEMKDTLSKRALAWARVEARPPKFIHPAQDDEPFLRELHRVGLFDLSINGETIGREEA